MWFSNAESLPRLRETIYVGPLGNYLTLKDAVDWFNASATSDVQIMLDSGDHEISNTVTINNPSFQLEICGNSNTYLNAAVGLSAKPMFILTSDCTIKCFYADGSTLPNYGVDSREVFALCNETGIYVEIVDFSINYFYTAILDTAGMDYFAFNFYITNCVVGCDTNYVADPGYTTFKDIEIGNFEKCNTAIKMTSAYLENFMIAHIIFIQIGYPTATSISYDGTNYHPGLVFNLFNNTYDNVGTFMSGFDFSRTDGRDANIEVYGNVGTEDKSPHCYYSTVDNISTTVMTAANTFYKVNFNARKTIAWNLAATAGTFTLTVNNEVTTPPLAWNATTATIKAELEALGVVTTVNVVQVIAARSWTVEYATVDEGWIGYNMTADISGLTGPTSYDITPDTYSCKMLIQDNRITYLTNRSRDGFQWVSGSVAVNANNRTLNIGLKRNGIGNIINPVSVRTGTADQPVAFSTSFYAEDLQLNDYFEIWCAGPNAGDTVTLGDVTVLFNAK
jgi:hypothetical protein